MNLEDRDEQDQEIQVLNEIYGEEFIRIDQTNFLVHVGVACVKIHLPLDYPSNQCPDIHILNWPESSESIAQLLKEMYIPGNLVLFEMIEFVRDALNALEAIVEITPSTDEPARSTISIISGDPVTVKKSVFQAHYSTVSSVEEVYTMMEKLLQNTKVAKATHNIMAYRIERKDSTDNFLCDNDEDGENSAGVKLAQLLDVIDVRNVVVVV